MGIGADFRFWNQALIALLLDKNQFEKRNKRVFEPNRPYKN